MDDIRSRAEWFAEQHRKAFEVWEHGDIKEVEKDKNGDIRITYADGKWWWYRKKAGGKVIFW